MEAGSGALSHEQRCVVSAGSRLWALRQLRPYRALSSTLEMALLVPGAVLPGDVSRAVAGRVSPEETRGRVGTGGHGQSRK